MSTTTLGFTEAARFLSELGHPHRLQIFNMLAAAGEAGARVGEIQARLSIPKSTLSHHIAQLVAVGLISQSREGRVQRCCVDARNARLVQHFINACCDALPRD